MYGGTEKKVTVRMAHRIRAFALLGTLMLGAMAGAAEPSGAAAQESRACGKIGTWYDPATGRTLAVAPLMASLARRPVVLLGEEHDNEEHHRWQLQTLAALHAWRPAVVVGFEMFPRRVQPVLDRWADGSLTVPDFLVQSDWEKVWGFDPDLYLPLFHFVRQNRLSMIGLNVERSLIARIGRVGWDAIPADQRAGLATPAMASEGYLRSLADLWTKSHQRHGAGATEEQAAEPEATDPDAVMEDENFRHFVAAQQTWDRAMAEALADARRKRPDSLIVGVMGQGHAEYGYGVPHQLKDIGLADSAVLLPVESTTACQGLAPNIADAVFIVAPRDRSKKPDDRPRLGVRIEAVEQGILITSVIKGSIAEASELAAKDIVLQAAGLPVRTVSELVAIVGRQAPGTWLPLLVRRGGAEIEIVAKFPAAPRKTK